MNGMGAPVGLWLRVVAAITWQLAALVGLGLVCEWLPRLRHPRVRHALWWFVLLAPLLLTPARLWLAQGGAQVKVTVPASAVAALELTPQEQAVNVPLEGGKVALLRSSPATAFRQALPATLAALWAAGCLLLVVRLAVGHWRARQLLALARPVAARHVREALSVLCARAGLVREVDLRTSEVVDSAMLYGLSRPVILLPREWLAAMDLQHLRAMLAHEVAHVQRRDLLANLVQRAAEAVLFFHPAAWLADRKISLAREELCDEWALAQSATRTGYARTLAMAAERAQARLAVATVGLAESRFTLLRRVEAIMKGEGTKRTSRVAFTALATMALVVAVVFATVQVRATSTGGGGGGRQETAPRGGGEGAQPQAAPTGGGGGGEGRDSVVMKITLADLDRKQLRTYRVGKRVSDYPDREDLSSPELAYVTINRAIARGDREIWSRISARGSYTASGGGNGASLEQVDAEEAARRLAAEISEVWIYQQRWGAVIAHMSSKRPEGTYNVRFLELKHGRWMNRGESPTQTIAQARDAFARSALGPLLLQRLADEATAAAMKRPAQFTGMAEKLFLGLRTADYAALLAPGAEEFELPVDYMVSTDYPSWVKWVCTTFSKEPIVDVRLGTVFQNSEGRPTVPYRLTLKGGRVLVGDLPFYVDVARGTPAWQAGTGLDWHLQEGPQPE